MKNYWPAGQPNKGHEVLLFLADEHIAPALIRGLHARHPGLSILRVQDIGLRSADDRDLLAWAAGENRIFITHDRNTVPAFAYDRIRAGQPMPGVFILDDRLPLGQAIEELLLLALCSKENEWRDQVVYIPM